MYTWLACVCVCVRACRDWQRLRSGVTLALQIDGTFKRRTLHTPVLLHRRGSDSQVDLIAQAAKVLPRPRALLVHLSKAANTHQTTHPHHNHTHTHYLQHKAHTCVRQRPIHVRCRASIAPRRRLIQRRSQHSAHSVPLSSSEVPTRAGSLLWLHLRLAGFV